MAFDGVLKFGTAIDQSGFKSGLSGLGNLAKTTGTAVAGAFMGAAAAGTAAVAAIGKQALDAYADFEQLAGGVETLFGDAAETVMENAAQAFKTAGMSANEYMETATASAAAMVASLAGDTQKAAELTDMAVMDMSDNANKMGTAMENIQNAYAGFAKGNFTMLDNLKLGYGGTKTEMERLLVTAQELTGIQYDISNYADIVQAIHAIQEQMGVTGTTAREASETISGSTAAVKAAWDNLLVGIADDSQDFDKLAQDFVTSVETAAGNILPRIETIGGGVVKLIGALGDDAVRLLTDALSYAPELASIGVQLIEALLEGLTDHLPELLDSGKTMLLTLANGAINGSHVLLDAVNGITDGISAAFDDQKLRKRLERLGRTLLHDLGTGLTRNLPVMLEAGAQLLTTLGESLLESLPLLLEVAGTLMQQLLGALSDPEVFAKIMDAGAHLLTMLADAVRENLDPLLAAIGAVITAVGSALLDPEKLSAIIEAGGKLLVALVDGLTGDGMAQLLDAVLMLNETLLTLLLDPGFISQLAETGTQLLTALVKGLCSLGASLTGEILLLFESVSKILMQVDWLELGKALLGGILEGVQSVDFTAFWDEWFAGFSDIVDFFSEVWDNFKTGWEDVYSKVSDLFRVDNFSDLGYNIIAGIWNGIDNATDWLIGQFSGFKDSVLGGLESLFGIASPSKLMRDQIGKNLALGIGEGFEENLPEVGREALTAFRGMEREVLPDTGEMRFRLTPDIDTGAFDAMREVRTEIDASALDALRVIVPEMAASRYIEPPAATYITNYDTSYITNSENHAAPEPAAPGGDIIIPVNIGWQQLDTIVIKAAQIANARSGGVTI